MTQEIERSYIAFISYRHKPLDKKAAEMIQKNIERYNVPKEFREKIGGSRLGMVFRDEDELPASSSLSNSITYALDHSKYLLVICTPDLPDSKWCEQEIRYFLETHDRDHILAVLVSGDPETSFSPYLLHTFDENGNITGDTEPLAANIAGPNNSIDRKAFKKEIVRIYAALIGCPFDALWQRERRAKTSRLLILSAIIMTAMAIFLGVVLSKNAQIAAQNDSLQRQMSAMHVDTGRNRLDNYDVKGALSSGIEALLGDPDGALYDHRAEKLLADALYAYEGPDEHSSLLYSQPTAIESMAMTEDGRIVAFADESMTVRAIETTAGNLLWEYAPASVQDSFDYSPVEVFACEGCILCRYSDCLIARTPSEGTEIWRYQFHAANHFRSLSSDGDRIMLLDTAAEDDDTVYMIVLDTESGRELGRIPVSSEEDSVSLSVIYPWYCYAGAFSDDGHYGATAIYVTHTAADGKAEEDGTLKFTLYDLQNYKEVYHLYTDEKLTTTSYNYGIAVLNNQDLLCIRYIASYGGLISTLIDGDTLTGEQILTNQTIGKSGGTLMDLYEEYKHVIPMHVNRNLAYVASENTLFVYKVNDGIELVKDIAFNGNVLFYGWCDKTPDTLCTWSESGYSGTYEMNQDGTMDEWGSESYDQTDLRLLCPLYDEVQNLIFTISVTDSAPGDILMMKSACDPSGEIVKNLPDVSYMQYYQVTASPSEDAIYIKVYHDDTATVIACDPVTGKETARADLDMSYNDNTILALDGGTFLHGKHIYKMDGSSNIYLENLSDANESKFFDGFIHHIILSGGQVMSYYDTCASHENFLVPCWIDGKFLESSSGTAAGISFTDGKLLKAGRNGCIVGYGIHRYMDEDGTIIVSKQDGFMVFDALNGRRILCDDPHPEARERHVAVGNMQPVFVCADDHGNIVLYDLEHDTSHDLETAYSIGDIVDLTFSPDDRYLLIITRSRKLEVYDIQENTYVFSEHPDLFSSYRYDYADELTCTESVDGRYIYLKISDAGDSCGLWLSIDRTSWTEAASSDLVYAVTPDNMLYAWRYSSLYRYPVHSLRDLADAASKKLQG